MEVMERLKNKIREMINELKIAEKLAERAKKTHFKKAEDVWILTILRGVRDDADYIAEDFEEWIKKSRLFEIVGE